MSDMGTFTSKRKKPFEKTCDPALAKGASHARYLSHRAFARIRFAQSVLMSASIVKLLENQEKVIAVIVGWIKPWRLSYEAESAPCGVIAHELFGNAVTFKIFFPWLVGFGRRVNDAQYSAGF